jgi:hypothetical protein
MAENTKRRLAQVSLAVLSIALIAAGIMRKEILDVIANATILCFSCIGLK